jgi:hypothetical protein
MSKIVSNFGDLPSSGELAYSTPEPTPPSAVRWFRSGEHEAVYGKPLIHVQPSRQWQKTTNENGETVYTGSMVVTMTPEMLERLLSNEE